jgi:predicted GH43/DUF377 family glycosyl hydrolase
MGEHITVACRQKKTLGGLALDIQQLRGKEELFQECLRQELKELIRHKDIDVVIGVPFYNEADTLVQVVTAAAQGLGSYLNIKPLIVCVGDPVGTRALATLSGLSIKVPYQGFLLPEGVNGRGFSIRAILEIARELGAHVLLLEADLKRKGNIGFRPWWLERLYLPLLQDYDLVAGCFRRHYFEDPTSSLFVGPMLETFFSLKLRDPLSRLYGISRRLVEDYCTDLDWWYRGVGGYGVDPWLLAMASKWDRNICEVSLGAKIGPAAASKRGYVFKQLALSLFESVKTNEDYWLKSQPILKRPDFYGLQRCDRGLELSCHLAKLNAGFSQGFYQYESLLGQVLTEETFKAVEKAARVAESPLAFGAELWAQVIYSFLQAYVFADDLDTGDLLEGLRVLYDGRLGSYITHLNNFSRLVSRIEGLDKDELIFQEAARVRTDQRERFLSGKNEFIQAWMEQLEEVRPLIAPLDYLEFIPGVPLALPADLLGIGGLPVRTRRIFRRLEERYSDAFHEFIHRDLKLDKGLTSAQLGMELEKFMLQLEQVAQELLPGDLSTAEGTRQVVERIFDLISHHKILAVKEEVLRQLLTEFPPLNLLIRLGFSSTAELLSHYDVRDALALAGISEEREYTDRLLWWLGDNLRPDSLEEVEMKSLVVTPQSYPGVGELRDISHFDRLAARLTASNLPKCLGGLFPKLRYFTHVAKILLEAEHYSFIWQAYGREHKGFGLKLVNSVIKHQGREVFSATNVFQNWHQRELAHRIALLASELKRQGEQEKGKLLQLMAKGYGLGLTLGDGTFIPCSAWTWSSFSFRGGEGIPTPLSVRIERDWFHHDLLEEMYSEMGLRAQDIMMEAIKRIGQGREASSLLDLVLRSPTREEVVLVQDLGSYPPAGQLIRHKLNPLLEPIPEHPWESNYVFNAAAVRLQGKVYVLYRAYGEDKISRIGLAIFDGARLLERLPEPVFGPLIAEESHGCEDPRVVVIDDRLYMVYTAYNGVIAQIAAAAISVDDFLARRFERFEHLGLAFPGLWDKDAILFPERIGGRWVMYHRVEPTIWVSYADELKLPWPKQNHKIIIGPRSGLMWDSFKIGAGAQPIKTTYGWLLIYHGVSNTMVYRLGVILVDAKDPGRLLYRSPNPVLSPETEHEVGEGQSWVPNVVFTCGAVPGTDKEELVDDDEILCYYGASDTYLCLASATVAELIPESVRHRILRGR